MVFDYGRHSQRRIRPQVPRFSAHHHLAVVGCGDQNLSQWLTEDTVRVADYYYLDYTKEKLNLYPGNVTAFEGTLEDKQLKEIYGKPKNLVNLIVSKLNTARLTVMKFLKNAIGRGNTSP